MISQSSFSTSSHTFSLTSLQTSSCTFLQSLIGISLQTSSSTNSSSNLVSGPQSSTGLETQDPSTGCERPSLSSISQISSMTVLQTVSVYDTFFSTCSTPHLLVMLSSHLNVSTSSQ